MALDFSLKNLVMKEIKVVVTQIFVIGIRETMLLRYQSAGLFYQPPKPPPKPPKPP